MPSMWVKSASAEGNIKNTSMKKITWRKSCQICMCSTEWDGVAETLETQEVLASNLGGTPSVLTCLHGFPPSLSGKCHVSTSIGPPLFPSEPFPSCQLIQYRRHSQTCGAWKTCTSIPVLPNARMFVDREFLKIVTCDSDVWPLATPTMYSSCWGRPNITPHHHHQNMRAVLSKEIFYWVRYLVIPLPEALCYWIPRNGSAQCRTGMYGGHTPLRLRGFVLTRKKPPYFGSEKVRRDIGKKGRDDNWIPHGSARTIETLGSM
jgi:hypothetical protein